MVAKDSPQPFQEEQALAQDFGRRIYERRKEIQMTQEQLAEAMHVSRQTVSHWENGRRQPDEATLAAVWAALGVAPEAVCPASQPADAPVTPAPRKPWLAMAAAVCAATLLVLLIFNIPNGSAPAPDPTGVTQADLLKPVVARDGVAHLAIEPRSAPVKRNPQIIDQMADGWNVEYTVRMQNEMPFVLTQMTEICFTSETHSKVLRQLSGLECLEESYFPHLIFQPGESFEVDVDLPSDDIVAYGVILEGLDTYGNTLRFTQLIPLSQEYIIAETVEEFRKLAPRQAAKGYLQLSPVEGSVRSQYDENYQAALWRYQINVTNTAHQTMTITNWKESYFQNNVVVAESSYDAEHLSQWYGSNVLKCGESWLFVGELSEPDFSGVGTKVTAVDEHGNEQLFVCYVDLLPTAE